MDSLDFRKHIKEGDRTLTNSGEYVQIFAVYPSYLECAVLDFKTGELVSENVRTVTLKDFLFDGSYKGIREGARS